MPQKKKPPAKKTVLAGYRCVYAFNEGSYEYRRLVKGLRGKRREAVKIAVARAAKSVEAMYDELEKQPRFHKIKSIGITFKKAHDKAASRYESQMKALFPEIKMTLRPYGHGGYYDATYIASLITDPPIRELIFKVQDLADKLRKEQREASIKTSGELTDCGVRIPRDETAKKVLADAHLKKLIDNAVS